MFEGAISATTIEKLTNLDNEDFGTLNLPFLRAKSIEQQMVASRGLRARGMLCGC